MADSIEFKFDIYVIGHRPTHCIDFVDFRIDRFFTGLQKIILIHYIVWSQIIRSILVPKWRFRLSSYFIGAL